ncbi:MAG: TonB-dependent receptor [Pseudomonadales bacterium]
MSQKNKRFELSGKGLLARSISAATVAGIAATPMVASAEEQVIEEIVVTVQRREEALSDVPIAVTALTGEFIREVNLDDVKDLVSFTPGLTGNSKDSFIDALNIRGVLTNDFGVGGDPSISIFKNNLYQGRNGAVVTSLYDVDRAEVLRGPQSFLFGRNSIAGGISVHTRRPELTGRNGYVELDVGERNHVVAEGAVNVPLTDHLAMRLAGYGMREDGYVKDAYNPNNDDMIAPDKRAGRLSLRYQADRTDVNFMAEYETRKQSGSIYRATQRGESWQTLQDLFGVTLAGGRMDSDSDLGLGERDNADIWSYGLEIEHDLDWATFTSITGYKKHNYSYAEDFDGTPLRINDYQQDQDGDYFEQEFRLVSEGDSPLSWYAGVSYYKENIDALFTQASNEDVMCTYYLSYYGFADCTDYFAYYGYVFTPNPDGLVERNRAKGRYEGWAAYVDLTYEFTDKLDASLGLRYTFDEKNFKMQAYDVDSQLGPYFALGFTTVGYLEDTKNWNDLSPRLVVRYRPDDDWMVYASVTSGYKSGGFGSFAIYPDVPYGTLGVTRADAVPDSFDPESVVSYEMGTKGKFADGRARIELTGYYYTYEDLQTVVPGQGGGILVDNIGEVDGWGLESSLNVILSDNFDLYLSAAWADTEANKVQAACDGTNLCEGNPLPELPEFSYSAVLQGLLPVSRGEWVGRVELFGQTDTGGGLEGDSAGAMQGWTEAAVRAGYRSNDGWEAMAYVENVTDEEYWDAAGPLGGILPAHYFGPSRPRTIGVKVSWTFE